MVSALLVLLAILLLIAVTVAPKSGFYLIWIVLCTFPNGWWEELDLPLNMGFDDMLVCYWALIVVFRGGLRFSRSQVLMMLYLLTVCLGNATGYFLHRNEILGLGLIHVREVLKAFTFVLLAVALNGLIDGERDFRRAWMGMVTGLAAGGILAIYSCYDLSIMSYFGGGRSTTLAEWGGVLGNYRLAGAFMEPITAALVMMLGLATVLFAWYQCRIWGQVLLIGCALIFAAAAFMSGTRAVVVALVMAALAFPLLRGSRKILVGLGVAGLLLVAFDPDVIANTWQRLESGELGEDRFRIWSNYLGALDFQRLFLGQGQWPAILGDGQGFQGHNAFIDMLSFYSIWGLLTAIAIFVFFVRRLVQLRSLSHPMSGRLSGSAAVFLIFFLAFSLTTETMTPQSWGLRMLFVMLVLLDAGLRLYVGAPEEADLELGRTVYAQPVL